MFGAEGAEQRGRGERSFSQQPRLRGSALTVSAGQGSELGNRASNNGDDARDSESVGRWNYFAGLGG